eukprot:14263464-Heterocapsa_arctica.AAC.1
MDYEQTLHVNEEAIGDSDMNEVIYLKGDNPRRRPRDSRSVVRHSWCSHLEEGAEEDEREEGGRGELGSRRTTSRILASWRASEKGVRSRGSDS